jgi:hypothetical protein
MPAYPENVRSPGQTGSRCGPAKSTRLTQLGHRVAVLELIATATGVRSGDQIFAMLVPDEHARDEVSSKVDMVRLDRESARPQVVFTFFSRLLSPPA